MEWSAGHWTAGEWFDAGVWTVVALLVLMIFFLINGLDPLEP